jgi:hypothetical protein
MAKVKKCIYCGKKLPVSTIGNYHLKCRKEAEALERRGKRTVIRYKR